MVGLGPKVPPSRKDDVVFKLLLPVRHSAGVVPPSKSSSTPHPQKFLPALTITTTTVQSCLPPTAGTANYHSERTRHKAGPPCSTSRWPELPQARRVPSLSSKSNSLGKSSSHPALRWKTLSHFARHSPTLIPQLSFSDDCSCLVINKLASAACLPSRPLC
ncbi:uncharacterized protein BDZ83DRAFT_269679 [Colletotrichum acutatum]|uniref:Uncharacterized protein n=1 Tax=Glomerella acutata TaxID=27357 RepID=A0AAD8UP11_GLOAC|nr:uncharacterized protein BDZ83DRAFT_269679 [Colletotrichum acutatum]KAK1726277.1 hypothetical protein BDZ83DRAFT_269679 [Colletotrichum acutatum]